MTEILTPSAFDAIGHWHSRGEAAGKDISDAIVVHVSFVSDSLLDGIVAFETMVYEQMVTWGVPAIVMDSALYVFLAVVS